MNQTKKNGNWKRKMEPYAFLVPLVLILFVFLVIPLVKAAIMSFQYYYVTKPSPNGHYFVGLENYFEIFKSNIRKKLSVTPHRAAKPENKL